MAVDDAAAIVKWREPGTWVIDIKGRTVIPGLIDNHAHYVPASAHWAGRTDAQCPRRSRLRYAAVTPDSGQWHPLGLGTDATIVTPVRPFITLGWAVTGRMVGGFKVTSQTIGREDALIAYTRSNAYFLFQESNLGSIETGKLADLVVFEK